MYDNHARRLGAGCLLPESPAPGEPMSLPTNEFWRGPVGKLPAFSVFGRPCLTSEAGGTCESPCREFTMAGYHSNAVAELAHQLRLSPVRLRLRQLDAAEYVADLIEPARNYPYEFVCHQITGFRPKTPSPNKV